MNRKNAPIALLCALACSAALAAASSQSQTREFPASSGGKLTLDLEAGGTVSISGTGGSSIVVSYSAKCTPECVVSFDDKKGGLEIASRFSGHSNHSNADVDFDIKVPRSYDVELDSSGGALSIDGVEGTFEGETKGGAITLHDVHGTAKLSTMGGKISLTDSTLDGSLKTMGGAVLFENVVGDVRGSSMGGAVRYKNVKRTNGKLGSPPRSDGDDLTETNPDSVQISTMGGEIKTDEAPEGADVLTMGGNIEIKNAARFVRAKTMGGDIEIDSIDGWVNATTMGGNIDVTMTGGGGDATLTTMGGDIVLRVPPGFGMKLDLEIAFTRNSGKDYKITAPGGTTPSVTPDWDHTQGTPRKYIRSQASVNGGAHAVKIKTINGNITVVEGS